MSKESDVKQITAQEAALVFEHFDEHVAYAIGTALHDRAVREGLSIVADIRTWGRPLYYMALPGTNGDNQNWVRRKFNVVQLHMKSTYRLALERSFEDVVYPPNRALDPKDYVLAGGGFPIKVRGAGVIGAITVSGLHERDDHRLAVDAIAEHLKLDADALRLPPLTT